MSITPTNILFCHQTWQSSAIIQHVETRDELTFVVTECTPFHPVSHIWPDHPADRGTVSKENWQSDVVDCLTGAIELATGELFVDKAIPVKRDTEGWAFVVVHCLPVTSALQVGDRLEMHVDKDYQDALSRGHSAGHIAYLALNKVLTEQGYWRKDADRKDPHGHYDFNSYAQETSFVTEDKCLDTYRLGKTLRKRGLNSADMLQNLAQIQEATNQQVASWLTTAAEITVNCHGAALTDSRYWEVDLGEAHKVVLPCGGTHARSLTEYQAISVTLKQIDDQNIEMHSDVIAA